MNLIPALLCLSLTDPLSATPPAPAGCAASLEFQAQIDGKGPKETVVLWDCPDARDQKTSILETFASGGAGRRLSTYAEESIALAAETGDHDGDRRDELVLREGPTSSGLTVLEWDGKTLSPILVTARAEFDVSWRTVKGRPALAVGWKGQALECNPQRSVTLPAIFTFARDGKLKLDAKASEAAVDRAAAAERDPGARLALYAVAGQHDKARKALKEAEKILGKGALESCEREASAYDAPK